MRVSFVGTFGEVRKATISIVMSLCPSTCSSTWKNSVPTGRIFMKFDIRVFIENLLRKFKFHWNLTKITGALHENQHTFMKISRRILIRIRDVSDKICSEKENTSFLYTEKCAFLSWCAKDMVEPDRPQNIIRRIRFGYWIIKATDTLVIINTYYFLL
jgi:hypothetical protein